MKWYSSREKPAKVLLPIVVVVAIAVGGLVAVNLQTERTVYESFNSATISDLALFSVGTAVRDIESPSGFVQGIYSVEGPTVIGQIVGEAGGVTGEFALNGTRIASRVLTNDGFSEWVVAADHGIAEQFDASWEDFSMVVSGPDGGTERRTLSFDVSFVDPQQSLMVDESTVVWNKWVSDNDLIGEEFSYWAGTGDAIPVIERSSYQNLPASWNINDALGSVGWNGLLPGWYLVQSTDSPDALDSRRLLESSPTEASPLMRAAPAAFVRPKAQAAVVTAEQQELNRIAGKMASRLRSIDRHPANDNATPWRPATDKPRLGARSSVRSVRTQFGTRIPRPITGPGAFEQAAVLIVALSGISGMAALGDAMGCAIEGPCPDPEVDVPPQAPPSGLPQPQTPAAQIRTHDRSKYETELTSRGLEDRDLDECGDLLKDLGNTDAPNWRNESWSERDDVPSGTDELFAEAIAQMVQTQEVSRGEAATKIAVQNPDAMQKWAEDWVARKLAETGEPVQLFPDRKEDFDRLNGTPEQRFFRLCVQYVYDLDPTKNMEGALWDKYTKRWRPFDVLSNEGETTSAWQGIYGKMSAGQADGFVLYLRNVSGRTAVRAYVREFLASSARLPGQSPRDLIAVGREGHIVRIIQNGHTIFR